MEKHEFLILLRKIEAAYPHNKIGDETALMWRRACLEMDFHHVMGKLIAHIENNPYPPSIAEIAVFTRTESLFLHQAKRWEQEGRERIERDQQLGRRKPVPSWLSERAAR
ncbi:hypothetical protein M3181_19080 [Mesobacillus maritimus]|uniref:hypothetical protein n=1 Tax=Mesobacillus maritimus TaxID=1643336 RepID=UPI00203B744D|nr:hypothetical protein [Mesobacillus maritimus]MCM3671067.1 hypothetical protein [Mesobacillus maritimus]